jgi:hypothetical protein
MNAMNVGLTPGEVPARNNRARQAHQAGYDGEGAIPMNTRFVWRGVLVRLEFMRYLDGSLVIEAVVDGAQNVARCALEDADLYRRFTAYIGLGRALGDRNALVAIKNCAENDGIVPTLIAMGIILPALCRTVPSVFGSCLVYELTDDAQALANDHYERVDA